METIQRKTNSFLFKVQKKIPLKSDRFYNLILRVTCIILTFVLWNYHLFEGVGHGFFKQAVIILFVGLGIIGVRIYKPVEKKVNYIFLGIWSILGILQFVSALTVSKEYLFFAIIWTFGYPVFSLFWSSKDMLSKLIYSMAVAINIVFVTMTAVAILLVPITMTYQYNGFTRNPNSFGEQLIASFPALLYLFYCAKNKIAKRFHFVLICISLAFTFFSRSRTTLLAVTGMLLCFLILYAYKEKKKFIIFIKMAVAILLGTIICVVGLFGLNKASSFVIKGNNLPVLTFLSPGFNENYYLKNIENEKKQDKLNNIFNAYAKRMAISDKSINTYSSGRVAIWKNAFELFNWRGNSSDVHINMNITKSSNTHNTTMQFIFNYGYLAGAVYLFMICYNFYLLMKRLKEKKNLTDVFFLLVNVGYLICTQFASMISPFYFLTVFMYYFTCIPSFFSYEENEFVLEKKNK